MDSTNCVICYEKKATKFCGECKQSSGVCGSCYMTLNANKYGPEDGWTEYAEPINCVICKKNMDYAALVSAFNMDADDLEELFDGLPEEKKYNLRDLVSNNAYLGYEDVLDPI